MNLLCLSIPRLDRGIQFIQYVWDCPVTPDNDDSDVFTYRVNNKPLIVLYLSVSPLLSLARPI